MNIGNVINSEKYCHRIIGIGIGNTLLLVLTIVFTTIVNIPASEHSYLLLVQLVSWAELIV